MILDGAMVLSHASIKGSYTDAFHCEHGCECEFISATYNDLKSQIEMKEIEIQGLIEKQVVIGATIDVYEEDPCDF